MPTREQELERQLQEYRKAKEALLSKIDGCLRVADSQKCKVYDMIVPYLKSAIETKVRDGTWDWLPLCEAVTAKLARGVCGDNVFELLEKL